MDERVQPGVDRRALLKRAVTGSAVAWAAPMIASAPALAAPGSTPPDDCTACTLNNLRITHSETGPPGDVVVTFTARATVDCACDRRVRYEWACLTAPLAGADCTFDPNGGTAREFKVRLTTCPTTFQVSVTVTVRCGTATCSDTLSRGFVYDQNCSFVLDP